MSKELEKYLASYLVGLDVVYQKGNEKKKYTYSSFPMSVGTDWILVTAGHCLEEVEKLRNQYSILSTRLVDFTGTGNELSYALPFSIPDDLIFANNIGNDFEDLKFDCGFLLLPNLIKLGLEANKVRAFEIQNAFDGTRLNFEFDRICVLGLPDRDDLKSSGRTKRVEFATPYLVPIDDVSAIDPASLVGVARSPEIPIYGISGGPWVGINEIDNGYEIALLGIQSRKTENGRKVFANRIDSFARTLIRRLGILAQQDRD